VPSGLTSFVWSGNGHTNVSGAISDTIASLAPGASVTYTVVASIDASATGVLTNTVSVTAATYDTNAANNTATDIDNLTPQNNVSVTKVDNKGGSSITSAVGSVVPGTSFTYTIVVSNSGPSTATSVAVRDTLPAGITSDSWTGTDGSSGTGAISDTIASLAPAATVTYTVTATVSPSATAQLVNTVTATAANDTNTGTTVPWAPVIDDPPLLSTLVTFTSYCGVRLSLSRVKVTAVPVKGLPTLSVAVAWIV
jgi:uncharacterized repeat protein (TIGR01451 family)